MWHFCFITCSLGFLALSHLVISFVILAHCKYET